MDNLTPEEEIKIGQMAISCLFAKGVIKPEDRVKFLTVIAAGRMESNKVQNYAEYVWKTVIKEDSQNG